MPRHKNHKCAACIRLSDEQAQQRDCWEGQNCRNRRSYYRHRQQRNSDRRLKYRLNKANPPSAQTDQPITISVAPPPVTKPLAVAVVYSPPTGGIHAIAYQVWQDGRVIGTVEAVHCTGWSTLDLKAHTQNVLGELNKRFGVEKLASRTALPAAECPLVNCPLTRKT